FGFFTQDPWTSANWRTTFGDRVFLGSAWNTLILGASVAAGSVVIHAILAYVVVQTRYPARVVVDLVSWLPFTVPGIVLGLGLLTMFLLPQFRVLYGSVPALALALIISGTPLGVQVIKGGLMQLGKELEEASWVTGASRLRTYLRIVLPLVSPTLVVVG